MTDPTSFTAEHRSWQWELVLQYEEGSIPPVAWNEGTLTTIAGWYAKNLTRDQAIARYEQYYHRNRRRMTNRLEGAIWRRARSSRWTRSGVAAESTRRRRQGIDCVKATEKRR
jgi:hypothetical protein